MKSLLFMVAFTVGTLAVALGFYYILLIASILLPFVVAPATLLYLSYRDQVERLDQQQIEAAPAQTAVLEGWDEDWDDWDEYEPWPIQSTDAGPTRVLIVDDDPEAAEIVNQVFRQFGCRSDVTTTVSEARRHLEMRNVDVIILDWRLGEHDRGDQILYETIRQMKKRQQETHDRQQKYPRVITYSGVPLDEIAIPHSTYFQHVDHWSKESLNYNQMTARTAELFAAGAL